MLFVTFHVPDFPVWLMRRHTPALRAHELLVHAAGKVVACSPELRERGVRPGWSMGRAQAHAPLALLRPRLGGALQSLYWDDVLWQVNMGTPWLESPRPGLAVASGLESTSLRALAVRFEAQVGVASTRSTSLLAALATPPGRVRRLSAAQEQPFLDKLPIDCLSGLDVEAELLQKLHWFGFQTMGSLARLSLRQWVAQFGDTGRWLFHLAQADENDAVAAFVPPPCIRVSYPLAVPISEPAEVEPILWQLSQEAAQGLLQRHAQSVTLHLQTGTRTLERRRLLRHSTASVRNFHLAALALWQTLQTGSDIEAISLSLGGLLPCPAQQASFWDRRPAMTRAVQQIEARWPGSLFRIGVPTVPAYLPEEGFYRINPLS